MAYNSRLIALCLIALCILAGLLCIQTSINTPPLAPDEPTILYPALSKAHGEDKPVRFYPPFVYTFYGNIFKIVGLFTDLTKESGLIAGRVTNILLYVGNIALFFWASRSYLSSTWALFASFLFAFSPALFFSGVYVKTEGLLLMEILGLLLCAEKLVNNWERPSLHLLAGILCGLIISTKYNPLVCIVYFGSGFVVFRKNFATGINAIVPMIRDKMVHLFAASFVITGLFFWANLEGYGPIQWEVLKRTPYFVPHPAPFRSVAEWLSFPFGRFSYALIVVIPFFVVGLLNYMVIGLGLFCRVWTKRFFWIWACFALLYFLSAQISTLIRFPWVFTPILPFAIVASALFWKRLWESRHKSMRFLAKTGIVASVCLALYQYPAVQKVMHHSQVITLMARETIARRGDPPEDGLLLLCNDLSVVEGVDATDMRKSISDINPKYILAADTYFANFCKYKNDEGYAETCSFYADLISQKAGYNILWASDAVYPLQKILVRIDPEATWAFYFLERQSQ